MGVHLTTTSGQHLGNTKTFIRMCHLKCARGQVLMSVPYDSYFLKFERYMPHHLFPNIDQSLRGLHGLVRGIFPADLDCGMLLTTGRLQWDITATFQASLPSSWKHAPLLAYHTTRTSIHLMGLLGLQR